MNLGLLVSTHMFKDYPLSTQVFYGRIIYMVTLNLLAVQKGVFDVLLSETDDVYSFIRFRHRMNDISILLRTFPNLPSHNDTE
jgi:hypothetical protein